MGVLKGINLSNYKGVEQVSNQIRVERDGEVKIFKNQQLTADYLQVTKQAVSKGLRKQNLVNGAKLSVLYYKSEYTDKSKSLIVDGKLIGTYEKIERKGGNIFIIGFKES